MFSFSYLVFGDPISLQEGIGYTIATICILLYGIIKMDIEFYETEGLLVGLYKRISGTKGETRGGEKEAGDEQARKMEM